MRIKKSVLLQTLFIILLPTQVFAVGDYSGNISAGPSYQLTAFRHGRRMFNPAWTKDLVIEIKKQMPRFEQARDINEYCPAYANSSQPQKINCWFRISTGIMAFESGFRSNLPGDGGRSRGLMQIMDMNCRRDRIVGNMLYTPKYNFICGLRLMGDLISRYKVIAQEGSCTGRYGTVRTCRRGLGRGGWSVMMRYQKVGKWQVGHLTEITKGVRTFRDPSTGTKAYALRYDRKRQKGIA
jgi:hypothetical protein